MFIYNVTTKINWAIAPEWVQWMKTEHIPEVLATGCFDRHQFVKLLGNDDEEGPTYAVQYYAPSQEHYNQYESRFAADFRNELLKKWGDQFIAFRSLMQVVA